jgi:hypothetical protein
VIKLSNSSLAVIKHSPFTGANISSAVIIGENNYSWKGLIKFVEKATQLKYILNFSRCGGFSRQTIHPHTRDDRLFPTLALAYHF